MQLVNARSPRQWFAATDIVWVLAVITAVGLTITVATGAPTSSSSEPAYSEGQPGLEVVAPHRLRNVPSIPLRKSAIAFLVSLYDCWSAGKASNCPVQLDVAPEAVDVVRTFSGTGMRLCKHNARLQAVLLHECVTIIPVVHVVIR